MSSLPITATISVLCAREIPFSRKKGFMDFAMYCHIVDEMHDLKIPSIRLQFYGEPLMHPRLFDMIQYAKENELRVDFDTNGYLLTESICKKIIESGLDELVISVHGMTRDDYRAVHKQDAFELVINNINTILKIQNDLEASAPAIVVQSAKMDANIQNFNRVHSLFSGAVHHSITHCGYNPHINTEDHRVQKYPYTRDVSCHSPYQMLAVSWDGDITICCADVNFELTIGRIEDGLSQAWHSKRMWKLREMHRKGIFPAVCRGCVDPVTYHRERI